MCYAQAVWPAVQLGSVPWDDLEGKKGRASRLKEIAVGSLPNYWNSKLMLIMMARELNKRLKVCVAPDSLSLRLTCSFSVDGKLVPIACRHLPLRS